MSSDIEIYCQQMEEIKNRISEIQQFLASDGSFGDKNFDYEFACIHLRKILELIAFSTLAANKNEYSRINKDFTKEWNAKQLLRSISKENPDFYPRPIKLGRNDKPGFRHFEIVGSGFLRKDDWLKLYSLCNKILHVWNPYDGKERRLNFERTIIEWVERIQKLLDTHYVHLLNDRGVWIVSMVGPDGKVHAYPSEPH